MNHDKRLIAGAMSGTSADGVDVALVQITGRGTDMSAKLLHHHHLDYDPALKLRIFALRGEGKVALAELASLGREISLAYAAAVNESLKIAEISAADLTAIAAHGQTFFHAPPSTIQWFDPSLVAAEVGCPVVSDFRRADCAAGGQGAPLVPFADYILFRDPNKNRVLLNIGGIANFTYLKAGGKLEEVIAFDTGPGNCVCDHLMRLHDTKGLGMDVDGLIASKGRANIEIIERVAEHDYFKMSPPKSTDGPEMIELFEAAGGAKLSLPDALFTALWITTQTIGQAVHRLLHIRPDEMVVSGGGSRNPLMMLQLKCEMPGTRVLTTGDLGMPPDAKEAVAFALLGAATLDNVPSNVPSVTGARRAVVLGSITPKPM